MTKLLQDRTTRQAVVQFSQAGRKPNCTVSVQFQVRGRSLFVSVFQRSQDIAMVEKDCETYARMACFISKFIEVDSYDVYVCVGNLHKYI